MVYNYKALFDCLTGLGFNPKTGLRLFVQMSQFVSGARVTAFPFPLNVCSAVVCLIINVFTQNYI